MDKIERNGFQTGQLFRHRRQIRRLVTSTALALRREIRAVCFQDDRFQRQLFENRAQPLRLGIGQWSVDAEHESEVKTGHGKIEIPLKTMENADGWMLLPWGWWKQIFPENLQHIVLRLAG